ncbi:FAD-dependent monooxygenase [Actinotalea ferrariae]|uniref:FAD-dependent monooxygenase n=1 Tax=Actinotalea ferrariae TaxID=1386098 RepID=UPI001C8BB622|nr:FAD-dependent monooxygenase [Actinotalea ferrariae]MBX9246429.1 FAD-dependent monooxygenase [Actinotalea ferrariae]
MRTALVVGGGVAGPAVALFLRRAGWDVAMVEAQPAPDPIAGSFLNLATNGLAVLDTLGLRDALLADAHPARDMVMWSGRGRRLGTVPNGPAREPHRASVIVRRGWLHEVLRTAAAAEGIPVRYGARLVEIEESSSGVTATFADGTTAGGDVLVGCDGIGSVTRTWIDPAAPAPRYTGLVGLGGYARVPGLEPTPDAQHFVFGARGFFGYLVRVDGTVYWFANVTQELAASAELDAIPTAAWVDRLRAIHADDAFPVPQILDHVVGDVRGYAIHDLSGVRRWSRGRVVAAGDAVHATSPSTGQGASLALEDAITLVSRLRGDADHEQAFADYQRVRRPRVERVVRYGRAVDSRKRVPNGRLGAAVRDAMMPMFLRHAAADTRNAWLYDHAAAWDEEATSR